MFKYHWYRIIISHKCFQLHLIRETPPADKTPDEEEKVEAQKIEAGSIEGSVGSASIEDKTDVSLIFLSYPWVD